jgi:hypothetical protein
MNRDDILWKGILEDVFDDFLRFFFEDADKLFDTTKGFAFLDKELEQLYPEDEIQASRVVDKLVKVFMREGNDEYMLLHIEVQGYKGTNFEGRMATYFSRIADKYKKPVVAIAILTDANKKFRPVAYQYNYLDTSLAYRFKVYKIIDQQEAALRRNTNPFAVVILTVLLALKKRRLKDHELFSQKLGLAKNLLRRKIPAGKTRRLLRFLKYYVQFGNKENVGNFDNAICKLTNKKEAMGIEEFMLDRAKKEGIEEGLKKGLKKGLKEGHDAMDRKFVKSLLLNTDFTIAKIARLADTTQILVRKVKKSLN